MNTIKAIIYILVCVGMLLITIWFDEIKELAIILAYTFGVGVGFVIWKNK